MVTTTSRIVTSQADIHVMQSSGHGLPIVMIHGTGASSAAFRHQFDSYLGAAHRLIAMDLPGHGKSTDAFDPQNAYTFEGLAKTVGEVMDALRLDRAAIFGWSLGGHVAIDLMTWHPAVAGIVVTGAPPIQRGPLGVLRGFHFGRDNLLASKPQFNEAEAKRFLSFCYSPAEPTEFLQDIKRADGRLRKIVFGAMMRGDGIDQKRAVRETAVPVAVVNGAHEPVARLSYVSGLNYGNLWEGHCHVIDETGHSPFFSKPEVFNALLGRFANDIAVGGTMRPAARLAVAGAR